MSQPTGAVLVGGNVCTQFKKNLHRELLNDRPPLYLISSKKRVDSL